MDCEAFHVDFNNKQPVVLLDQTHSPVAFTMTLYWFLEHTVVMSSFLFWHQGNTMEFTDTPCSASVCDDGNGMGIIDQMGINQSHDITLYELARYHLSKGLYTFTSCYTGLYSFVSFSPSPAESSPHPDLHSSGPTSTLYPPCLLKHKRAREKRVLYYRPAPVNRPAPALRVIFHSLDCLAGV